jgi:predicted branched-subunit amino acid permease
MTASTVDAPADPGTDARARRAAHPVRFAVTDASTLLTGMVPFGIVVGITASLLDVTGPAAFGTSGLLFAGTAQMAGFAQLAAGSAPIAVITTILIVNARLLLYGAAIEHRFRRQPRWFRFLGPALLVDQTFAAATTQGPDGDRAFRRYWLALGLTVLAGWTGSIGAGMILGPALPAELPLDAAGIGCLIGLLLPRLTDRRAITAMVVALGAGITAIGLPAGSGVLLATTAGMLAGTLTPGRTTS